MATIGKGWRLLRDLTQHSRHELTTAMQHLCPLSPGHLMYLCFVSGMSRPCRLFRCIELIHYNPLPVAPSIPLSFNLKGLYSSAVYFTR